MFKNLYNELPNIAKPYLIIIVILLVFIDITVYRFYVEYKKQHQKPKEQPKINLKEK